VLAIPVQSAYDWLKNCYPPKPYHVKTLLHRVLPLLFCILVGMVVSWVSIYAFWFGVWTFHTVPAARFCDAVGNFILQPAHLVFNLMGGDQSTLFLDPTSFSETNGLIIGVILYTIYRQILKHRQVPVPLEHPPKETQRIEEKVS
jgi:hypothetical protein